MFGRRRGNVETPNWKETGGTGGFTDLRSDMQPFFNIKPGSLGVEGIPLGICEPGGYTGQLWNTKDLQGHGLCFAPNGTGKGASCIIPALLSYGGSMLVVDPKGENAWVTAARRRALGHKVVILDPWGEVNRAWASKFGVREMIARFNPLAFISRFSDDFESDCKALAQAIIITGHGGEDHWPDSARQLCEGCIALVKEAFGDRATLRDVRQLLLGDQSDLFLLVDAVAKKLPGSYGVSALRRFRGTTNEISAIFSSARTQTAFLDDPRLQDAMGNDDVPVRLDDFVSQPTTLFLVIPPDKLESHGRWLRMVLSLALRAITRAPEIPKTPVMMLIDEMGTIGPLAPIETAYGLLRGYGVRLFGFFQSLPQLQRDYPKTWSNFINNSSIVQILAAKDETAEHFSKMLGTTTIHQGVGQSAFAAGDAFNRGNPGAFVLRQPMGSRAVMYPHEIARQLGTYPTSRLHENTQLIVYMQGAKNVLTLQNPYFRHPGWRGSYRQHPEFRKG